MLGHPRPTVCGVLRRHRVPRLRDLDRPTRTPVRYERARPGALIHVDEKKLERIPPGGGHRIHGRRPRPSVAVASATTACMPPSTITAVWQYVEVLPDERALSCGAFMTRAGAWFASQGISIERVMTDNAFAYWLGRDFQAALTELGARPVDPRLPSPADREGRAVQPVNARGVAYVRLYRSNGSRLAALPVPGLLQSRATPHLARRAPADLEGLNNVSGGYNKRAGGAY
jgi:hypothetical protein